jgi:hypothetical protein
MMNKKTFVEYDPSLDDYAKNHPNPFPAQIASVVTMIEKHEVAIKSYMNERNEKIKSRRSTLQNELLNIYTFDPTEQQLQQLKTFMAQLFADKLQEIKAEKLEEIAA